jgi:hypothetical protein
VFVEIAFRCNFQGVFVHGFDRFNGDSLEETEGEHLERERNVTSSWPVEMKRRKMANSIRQQYKVKVTYEKQDASSRGKKNNEKSRCDNPRGFVANPVSQYVFPTSL